MASPRLHEAALWGHSFELPVQEPLGGHRDGNREVPTVVSAWIEATTVGEQGDGIARVDHVYVLIVEDAQLDEEVVVEIEKVQSNVAFATVIE